MSLLDYKQASNVMSNHTITKEMIIMLEEKLNVLYEKVIPQIPRNCERMTITDYAESILSFTKPANEIIQAALKDNDTPEARLQIKLLVDKFRTKIFKHYNGKDNC